jgi:hypothetical protein
MDDTKDTLVISPEKKKLAGLAEGRLISALVKQLLAQ